MSYKHFTALFFLACWSPAASQTNVPAHKPVVWEQSTFADFSQGSFSDAGANIYVSAKGNIELINRWDLNRDGAIDAVFVNTHSHTEKLDAVVFWGNGKDFDNLRRSELPNDGAQNTAVADINGDGILDLVFPHYTNGTWDGMDSLVRYVGRWARRPDTGITQTLHDPVVNPRNLGLPTRAAQNVAVGDLNKDGYPDLVFALSAGFWEYRAGGANSRPYTSAVRIFWGSAGGPTRDNYQDLEAFGASDVALGDLNGDGWPDIAVANREKERKSETESFVYWGGPSGFKLEDRLALPTNQANAVVLADLVGDKAPDLIFANGAGPVSYAYENRGGRFGTNARLELPTSDARDCVASDFNQDGFQDVFFTNHQVSGNFLTTSVLYWGGPLGPSPDRCQRLQTTGAWGASAADLNRDGRVDLVVSNYREHHSHDIASHIFWNSSAGFSDTRRTSLFTQGAVGNTIADLDGDGNLDLLFNNTIGGSRGLGSGSVFVYWGNPSHQPPFSIENRTKLPALDPYGWAAADLNQDGWPDLIVANMDEVGRKVTENFIYWGGPDGFAETRRSAVIGWAAAGVRVADLDHNGYLDLVFTNYNSDPENGVLIYWGSESGYVTWERTGLPNSGLGSPTIADLNEDGWLDIVTHARAADEEASIYWGDGTRNYNTSRRTKVPGAYGASGSEAADLNRDGHLDLILTRSIWQNDRKAPGFIYYGNGRGDFAENRRAQFFTVGTQTVTVADINKDGWLDLVCPNYNDNRSRATLSRVYFGGASGISEASMLELPTEGGTGSQVFDFNKDGWNDILLVCHRSEGDPNIPGKLGSHRTNSFLYWGGPQGFSPTRRLTLPTEGAHYDSGTDLGNILDRVPEWEFRSSAYEYPSCRAATIEWNADTPGGSKVRFQVRTASSRSGLERAPWVGPAGKQSLFIKSGSKFAVPLGENWVQYRVILGSQDGVACPSVHRVKLSFF